MIMSLFSLLLRTFVYSWSTVIQPVLESEKTQPHNDHFWPKVNYVTFGLCNGKSVRLCVCQSVCNIRALWAQSLTFRRCFCIMLFFCAQATLRSKTRERSLEAKQSEAKQILDAGKQYWKMDASLCTTACILTVILSIIPRGRYARWVSSA